MTKGRLTSRTTAPENFTDSKHDARGSRHRADTEQSVFLNDICAAARLHFCCASPQMRMLWFIPVTLFAIGAGAFLRHRWRNRDTTLSSEPVSGEWLAQARSREDHRW